MTTTQARRQPKPVEYDVDDDDSIYSTRLPSSVRRYNSRPPVERATHERDPRTYRVQERTAGTLVQRRRSSLEPANTHGIASNAIAPTRTDTLPRFKRVPLVTILVGMVIAIVLVMGLTALLSWWHVYQDDLHYGRPRTSQLDVVVGHNDSAANPTHLIFLNLSRHVEIIELPGGDPSHAHIYTGPVLFGDGQDLTPVTGEVRDVNGDGKPDLVLHIQDQQIIFLNDGTLFHPQ